MNSAQRANALRLLRSLDSFEKEGSALVEQMRLDRPKNGIFSDIHAPMGPDGIRHALEQAIIHSALFPEGGR